MKPDYVLSITPPITSATEYAALLREVADNIDPPTIDTCASAEPPREWDVMLDLETWGLSPGCALRSIGAVCFDPHTEDFGPEFYCNVDGGQVGAGLKLEQGTQDWWRDNAPHAAVQALTLDTKPLVVAAQSFREWFHSVNGATVWAHGAAYDPPVLDVASAAVGVKVPWHYRAVRDTRTLYALASFDPANIPNGGIQHHALHDARFQALCVQAAMRQLHSPWGPVCGRNSVG